MFKNILLVAFRNLFRQKGYSIINILGLAIGIACAFLVMIYVSYELSFDKCYSDHERIFRVRSDRYSGETVDISALSSQMVAPTLSRDYPQVIYATRFFKARPCPVYHEGNGLYLTYIARADMDFFDIFDLEFICGSREDALKRPNTCVITEPVSKKFFGDENPIGKVLVKDSINYEITGVIEKWPENSHINWELILSWDPHEVWDFVRENPWEGIAYNYIKVFPETDVDKLGDEIENIWERYVDPEKLNPERKLLHYLQPLTDIHFNNKNRNDIGTPTSPAYLYTFIIIGLIILIIACINYMNLTTAQYLKRSREIAIRKTVGAYRRLLIFQFLTESLIFTFIAHVIAIFIVEMSLSNINDFLGLNLSIDYTSLWFIAGVLIMILFTGLLAGSYPAFFLSSFRPIAVIRGIIGTGNINIWIRRILVVLQFTISIALVIGVLAILNQLKYMKSHPLGFNKDNKIILRFPRNNVTPDNYTTVKQEFLSIPEVNKAAFSSTVPGQWNYVWRTTLPEWEGERNILMNWYAVDEDFIDVMDIELLAGENLNSEMYWAHMIINEEAVKTFDWGTPENAINKDIWREGRKVVGVVNNFHLKGLQNELQPMGMFRIDEDFKYLIIDVNVNDLQKTIESLRNTFNDVFPNAPFYYFFLDKDFDKQYKSEEQLSKLFTGITLLGLFIACLGLLGLASFVAQQRTKEVGIRKVNGASVGSIVMMLVRDFTRWVLLANIIAWPVSFLLINRWLEGFAFHINQNIWLYIISGGSVFILAVFTVSYRAWRAAIINPVDALRYE